MQNRDLRDEVAFLSEEQRKDPLSVITTYFDEISLYDARTSFWELFSAAMESEIINIYTKNARSNLLFFYKITIELIEASLLLHEMIEGKRLSYTIGPKE